MAKSTKNTSKTPIIYIEAKKKSIDFDTQALLKLPKKQPILMAYSIQYKQIAYKIKEYLVSKHYNILGIKQVLGCSKLKVKSKTPILLVSDGKFHALNLALQNKTPIYIYNTRTIETIDQQQIDRLEKQKQAALSKFLMADTIGILVSTKAGQNRMKDAKTLKKKLEGKGKKAYLFISDTLNLAELENFFIKIWVNTACPGLAYDSPRLVNLDDLSSIKY